MAAEFFGEFKQVQLISLLPGYYRLRNVYYLVSTSRIEILGKVSLKALSYLNHMAVVSLWRTRQNKLLILRCNMQASSTQYARRNMFSVKGTGIITYVSIALVLIIWVYF